MDLHINVMFKKHLKNKGTTLINKHECGKLES